MYVCMYGLACLERQQEDAEDADPGATGPGGRRQSEYVRHHDPEHVRHSDVADQLDLVLGQVRSGEVNVGFQQTSGRPNLAGVEGQVALAEAVVDISLRLVHENLHM